MTTRSLLTRLSLFLLGIAALQLGLGVRSLPEELATLREALDGGAEVLFIADSTNRAYHPEDADKRPISALLAERLGEVSVAAIDHGAWNTEVYRDVVAFVGASERRPRGMVFVLNARSFLPGWAKRPGWQFERERFALRHPWLATLWQPLAVFKAVDAVSVSEAEFRSTPVRIGAEVVGSVRDFLPPGDPDSDTLALTEDDMLRRMTCNYLGAIQPDSPRLAALLEIVELCEEFDIVPLFYVTPVDVETGEARLPGFAASVTANSRLLVDALKARGAPALDLSLMLDAEFFSWSRSLNEHLDERGKAHVAAALAEALGSLLAVTPAESEAD